MEPLNQAIATSLSLLTDDLSAESEPRQKFLQFTLGTADRGLLPLEQIAEVLIINTEGILPVPEMPGCVLGVCYWRGKMLWLVDLGHLLDYPPLLQLKQPRASAIAIVIQVEHQSLGLVVPQVEDIELHSTAQLQPATIGLFPAGLLPFIKGYFPETNNLLLDIAAIARFPLWQVHRS